MLQEQLKQIGIEAEMVLLDAATMLPTVYGQKDYDLAVTGTSGYTDAHDVMVENFLTGSGGNFVGYSNPQVDDLIDQGKSETDQEKRIPILPADPNDPAPGPAVGELLRGEPVRDHEEEPLRLPAHSDWFGYHAPRVVSSRSKQVSTTI